MCVLLFAKIIKIAEAAISADQTARDGLVSKFPKPKKIIYEGNYCNFQKVEKIEFDDLIWRTTLHIHM